MMHIKIHYGGAVTTVPTVDAAILARATADDLRVLLCLCARGGQAPVGENMDDLCAAVGRAAGCSAVSAAASIAFWRGTGVLEPEGSAPVSATALPLPTPNAEAPIKQVTPHVTVRRAEDHIPRYTTAEMNELLENRRETRENIDECNRIWGDLLNTAEVNILLGLSDYLGLDWDYILSLMARCVADMDRLGMKHSMRHVEKQALRFYDEEIRTLDALQEKFRALDKLRDAEGQLRALFGMGDRLLTPTEKKYFSTWLHDFRFDYEIIELAYTIAVDTKGTPKMAYMNSILANWNRDDLRTPAAIEASQAAFRADRERKRTADPSAKTAEGGSFDTENFFDAAVRRSLGDKIES